MRADELAAKIAGVHPVIPASGSRRAGGGARRRGHVWGSGSLAALVAALLIAGVRADTGETLAERVIGLGRDASWRRVAAIRVGVRTFHPQGMVKIGDRLFVSSVEVRVAPARTTGADGSEDRKPGEGVGHLFVLDASTGALIARTTLGDGTIYHPGGLDFDGTSIWVPVAEYRRDSRAIVYRVDPATLRATEVFRFADHLGALAVDAAGRALHGISWGSRRFYTWPIDEQGGIVGVATPRLAINPSHYVDYQDCQHVGGRRLRGHSRVRRQGRPPQRRGTAPDAPRDRRGGASAAHAFSRGGRARVGRAATGPSRRRAALRVIHLDPWVLIDAATGPRRSLPPLRAIVADGIRLGVSSLVLRPARSSLQADSGGLEARRHQREEVVVGHCGLPGVGGP